MRISRRFGVVSALLVCFAAFAPTSIFGQGFLYEPDSRARLPRVVHVPPVPRPIPRPELPETTPYKIDSITVDASIVGEVATVDVAQTFKNVGSRTIETSFVFPLPYDGAIDSMTLLVDGKEYPAKLLDAKEARSNYEEIVRKNRDPALLEWVGAGMFKTSVFPIPAGESRTISIRYSQLLRTSDGLTDFLFPMSCAKYTSSPVGKITFTINISGDSELKNVYSPSFDLNIERFGKNAAKVVCVLENKSSLNDFRLFFDRAPEEISTKIQSYRPNDGEDGYFLLLASPKALDENRAPTPKTIVFTLDTSGSMMGQKIEQARDSLKFALERLRDGDKFNIVLFASDVRSYKEELQTASPETRADAAAFVDSVRAAGSTHIEGAIKTSFTHIAKDDSANPKYLFFLSDGEATVGECGEMKLAEIARTANQNGARFFSFGLGFDVNSRLLDRFVRDGRGRGEYVKPNENIEDRVSALYKRVEDPVFSEVEFSLTLKDAPEDKYFVNLVYPSGKIDVFAGDQLSIVGRYSKSGAISGKIDAKFVGSAVEFPFEGKLTDKSDDASFAFIERIWAARRIGEIVDKLDLDGANQELLDELLELSKKHGVLTPYTAFLADDSVALNDAGN
ncbi:MAG: VWA domain-containing protein, partial [Thermoguttaceae bacterium]|nr:VWA domain-containing protein [Thermoguttaceae bacterium]